MPDEHTPVGDILEAAVTSISPERDDNHAVAVYTAVLRIALQHSCICLTEWICLESERHSTLPFDADEFAVACQELMAPSDGTLVSTLESLLCIAESLGWSASTSLLAKPLATTANGKVRDALQRFIRDRNDDVFGHGLPGQLDRAELVELAQAFVRDNATLPVARSDGTLELRPPNRDPITIYTLRTHLGRPICYRNIRRLGDDRCRVQAQYLTDGLKGVDLKYETRDAIRPLNRSPNQYEIISAADHSWTPFASLPSRVTGAFSGRSAELSALASWFDDVESRACLVWGDGGIGKTTLVVEFLHQALEGKVATTWRPELITFTSAKLTRWGVDGIAHIRSAELAVEDLMRVVARMLAREALDKSWYIDSHAVIDKLAARLATNRIERRSHLLIIDNAETLFGSSTDSEKLGKALTKVSRHIGRVLITSRRREVIEAANIEVPPLTVDESVAFLRRRGNDLGIQPLITAGAATLRRAASRLSRKPLLLEVLTQTFRGNVASLEDAMARVALMQEKNLGEFLYAGAWEALTLPIRSLFILMTQVSDQHDETLLRLCCKRCDVTVVEAERAMESSRGIATVLRLQGSLRITFTIEFTRFCEGIAKTDSHGANEEAIQWVRNRHREFIEASTTEFQDRLPEAFRTPEARAARAAFLDGDYARSIEYYELATLSDPQNALLFDRFAYALLRQGNIADAKFRAEEATRLAPQHSEPWFTLGLVHGRAGNERLSHDALIRAMSLGKPRHLCFLQMARASLKSGSTDAAAMDKLLDQALEGVHGEAALVRKHRREVEELRRSVAVRFRRDDRLDHRGTRSAGS